MACNLSSMTLWPLCHVLCNDSTMSKYEELLKRTCQEFPGFRVVERDKSWLRPVFWLLGKITRRDYSGFTTTIGLNMYVGSTWNKRSEIRKYKTLRHELVHVRQFVSWPLGRWAWPINHFLMAFCYLFILPVFWTLRAKFEREAYTQTLLFDYEEHGTITDERMEENARWIAETFATSTYLFMWTGNAAYRWAMVTQRAILDGKIRNDQDRVEPCLASRAQSGDGPDDAEPPEDRADTLPVEKPSA